MSELTQATTRASTRTRISLANGPWGALLFIATEATLFGCLIASYFYLRYQAVHWPPPGIEKPKVALPLVLTGILLATTLPLVASLRAARRRRFRAAWWLLLVAFGISAAYLGIQLHELDRDLTKFPPKESAYASAYFALLGVHHAHVALGLLMEVWLLGRLLGGFTSYRTTALQVVVIYGTFVNLLAIPVVLTQIYPSL